MKNSIAEVIHHFTKDQLDKGKAQATAKTYGIVLQQFATWMEGSEGQLEGITRHDVQSYINHLEGRGQSAVTIGKVFATLSVFARFIGKPMAVEDIRMPEARKQRNIAPKSLERNTRNKLLRAVEQDGNLRNIAITYTLLLTGIRVSELVGLNRDDVTIGQRSGSITVRNGKGNVARTIPLPAEARYHLNRYLTTRADDAPALFLSNFRKRISTRTVQHMLAKYGVHPHALRHTYCRELVAKGIDIATVAELAGHADINVTRRYSKPSFTDLEEAIDRAFN